MPVKASLLESSASSDFGQMIFAGIMPVAGYLILPAPVARLGHAQF
jgi:hypothetical protein